jgi:preprotein translocase subunit SecD
MKLTFKIWLMIFFIGASLLAIFAGSGLTKTGLLVTSIDAENNTLFDQGLRQGDLIIEIDGQKIETLQDYSAVVSQKFASGEDVKTEIKTDNNDYIIFSSSLPELTVAEIPNTNLMLGLDLAGGSRAVIKAENKTLTLAEVMDLVDITQNRLNAFGLTDLKVMPVSDLSGNNFMLIEIAGATPKDLKKMISEQGEFEAKIGNETVFIGGEKDIASVGRDAQNARIETCGESQGGYACRFSFTITLSPEAAQKHADVTEKLSVNRSEQGSYLSEKLELVLDGQVVDTLLISEGLKGRVTTQISISGSGEGETQEDAFNNAKEDMKKMQTILMTGSLPYKLEIVKLDTISPLLGEEFVNSILLAGAVAILLVSLIIFVRYRNWKASMALILVTVAEVVIILGVAALIRWNLDLPGIAGILATLGTGIDDLIILMDESSGRLLSLKARLKRAFTIIMGAYFTTLVSLLPLMWAGAGLLKGFAITTIIGISVGVFITRPAFSDMLKKFKKE